MNEASAVLADLRRHLARPSMLATPLLLLLPGILVLLGGEGEGVNGFLHLTYLVAPLGMAPLAAHRATADRERGQATVQAASPLSAAEHVLATGMALAIVLVSGFAVTLPVYVAALSVAPPLALIEGLAVVGFGLLVGLAAAAAGLLLGYALPARPRLAVGLSLALVLNCRTQCAYHLAAA